MGDDPGLVSSPLPRACTYAVGEGRDATFVELLRAFRRSGGLSRDGDVSCGAGGGDRMNACASASQRAICFEWGGSMWMPRFQFHPGGFSLRPGPAKVIGELESVFDGWEMATWFAHPNLWIGNSRPVDMMERCLDSVLGAARADRFIAAG